MSTLRRKKAINSDFLKQYDFFVYFSFGREMCDFGNYPLHYTIKQAILQSLYLVRYRSGVAVVLSDRLACRRLDVRITAAIDLGRKNR